MAKHSIRSLLIALQVLVYGQILNFDFIDLDDYIFVDHFSYLSSPRQFFSNFFTTFWNWKGMESDYFRPVVAGHSFLVTYLTRLLIGGPDGILYHLFNLIFHCGVVFLVFQLAMKLCRSKKMAFFIAMIFSIHPVSTSTVSWVGGCNELILSLSFLFAFLSFIQFHENKNSKLFFIHGISFLVALLTKESAIAIPILCVFYAYGVMTIGPAPQSRLFSLKKWILLWGPILIVWIWVRELSLERSLGGLGFNFRDILTSSIPNLIFYFGKMLPFTSFEVLPTLEDTMLTPGFFVIIFLCLGYYLLTKSLKRGKERRLFLFGIVWFLLMIIPTFIHNYQPLGCNLVLRLDRMYTASIGLWIAGLQVLPMDHQKKRLSLSYLGAIAVVLGLATATYVQAKLYRDPKTFYTEATKTSPHLPVAYLRLGNTFLREHQLDSAEVNFKRVQQLNPNEPELHNGMGIVHFKRNQLEPAKQEYQKEVEQVPNRSLGWSNLGMVEARLGNIQGAELAYKKAITLEPGTQAVYRDLIDLYRSQGRQIEANQWIEQMNRITNGL
jgi:protein O-mannosyl-transferase